MVVWFVLLTTCQSGDKVKEDELGGACDTYYGILVGKREGMTSLRRLSCWWQDNINIYESTGVGRSGKVHRTTGHEGPEGE